jgi:transposase
MKLRADICFKRQLAAYLHRKYPNRTAGCIGKELKYSSSWVSKWWNKNDEEPEEFKDHRDGRDMSIRSKITPMVERIIVRKMHGAKKIPGGFVRKFSQRKILKHLNVEHGIHLGRTTVRKIFKKNGLHYQLRLKEEIQDTETEIVLVFVLGVIINFFDFF